MMIVNSKPGALRCAPFTEEFFRSPLGSIYGRDDQDSLPRMNVRETPDDFHVELAAPGLNKDDFKLTLDKNLLSISVEVAELEEKKEVEFLRREFFYSNFRRAVKLPESVDAERIEAHYSNGVLAITLPKSKDSKTKMIPIS
jgi:HSP20 family protein